MRIKALTIRILNQLRHDRRTLALMLFAPIFLLTLVYFILGDTLPIVNVAIVNAPAGFEDKLEELNIRGMRYEEDEARQALRNGEIIASISIINGKSDIKIDGSNPAKAGIALAALEQAKNTVMFSRPDLKSEIDYIYGQEDLSAFDNFGATLIGFIVFFYVFLVSGISFLQERTTGTLDKLLSTPIRRWEIVVGYVLGFGVFTVLQSILVSWYCVYVLKVMMIGSFALILLITLLAAMISLALGILMSTLANNEFQMIQFIPIIIVPQMFFSGLFDIPRGIELIGYIMPLHYIADALTKVMIKGGGLDDIAWDLVAMLAYSTLFIILNTQLLKKYRRI